MQAQLDECTKLVGSGILPIDLGELPLFLVKVERSARIVATPTRPLVYLPTDTESACCVWVCLCGNAFDGRFQQRLVLLKLWPGRMAGVKTRLDEAERGSHVCSQQEWGRPTPIYPLQVVIDYMGMGIPALDLIPAPDKTLRRSRLERHQSWIGARCATGKWARKRLIRYHPA